MSDDFSVANLLSESEAFEFAADPEKAYVASSKGIPIIAEDSSSLLESFCAKNKAEFYGDQIEGCESGFRYFESSGRRYYFTFHKHKIREEHLKKLWEPENGTGGSS